MTGPAYNHTRGDSHLTPCPQCLRSQRLANEWMLIAVVVTLVVVALAFCGSRPPQRPVCATYKEHNSCQVPNIVP